MRSTTIARLVPFTLLIGAFTLLAGLAAPPARPQNAPAAGTAADNGRLAFDFKDPKGVNGLMFILDSPLEPMFGTGTGIAGRVEFDPADPMTASGTLTMDAKTLRMTNERMTAVLHGEDWLNVREHPTISVSLDKIVAAVSAGENTFDIDADVQVTIKDKSVPMTIPLRATYLPGRLGDRVQGAKGDLLVLRAKFPVKRSDFGIKPDAGTDIVADEIQITAAVVGVRKTG